MFCAKCTAHQHNQGLLDLDAEGVIGHSSLYFVLQRARARLKRHIKMEKSADYIGGFPLCDVKTLNSGNSGKKLSCVFCSALNTQPQILSLNFFHDISLEYVSNLDIVESVKTDTALIALSDLFCVVLKALE